MSTLGRFATARLEDDFWSWYTEVHLVPLDAVSLPFDGMFHIASLLGALVSVQKGHWSALVASLISLVAIVVLAALIYNRRQWYVRNRRILLAARWLVLLVTIAVSEEDTLQFSQHNTLLGAVRVLLRISYILQNLFLGLTYIDRWPIMVVRTGLTYIISAMYRAEPLCAGALINPHSGRKVVEFINYVFMSMAHAILHTSYEALIARLHAAVLQLLHPQDAMEDISRRVFLYVAPPATKLLIACKASINTLQLTLTFLLPSFVMLVFEQSARHTYLAVRHGIRTDELQEVLVLAYTSTIKLTGIGAHLLLLASVLSWLLIYPIHAIRSADM